LEVRLQALLENLRPGLIWLHNIAGGEKWGWSEKMVSLARQHAPVLWTLHDMWALGDSGEAYWEIESAVEGGKWNGAEQSGPKVKRWEGEQGEKVEGLRGLGVEGMRRSRVERVCGENGKYPVTVTAPSKWLADLTKKTTGQECIFLPNPIDLKKFSPGDRVAARRRLGLPEEGLVVLAGADSLADPRKGFDLLRAAWGCRWRPGATLALFGRHGENRSAERYLGNLTTDEEMVKAYRAADLYIHPARMENAPCTIQESLACGTPVLAFAVGGIPEMVQPGSTGFLVAPVHESALAKDLEKALGDRHGLEVMGRGGREFAEKEYAPSVLLEKFYQLFPGLSRR